MFTLLKLKIQNKIWFLLIIDNNIFEIDGLLENATFISFENFKIPNLHPIERNSLKENS